MIKPNNQQEKNDNFLVSIRIRPFSDNEKAMGSTNSFEQVDTISGQVKSKNNPSYYNILFSYYNS